jgi:methyltransferase (TIGR00027 family)
VDGAEASRTAKMAAILRGQHRLMHRPPWVLDDPFALILVGPEWPALMEFVRSTLRGPVLNEVMASALARSRYAEDRFEQGAFDQYVVLGAGLDSFAWRRPDLVASSGVFEVDHPASQLWKQERVAALGLPESDHHLYVPVDFERDSLSVALAERGFDGSRPAFFSWLGVTVYLTVGSIEATLRSLALGAPGTEIVLSYALTDPYLDDIGSEFRETFLAIAAAGSEPVRTRLSPRDAEALTERCGFRVVEHLSRDDLEGRYFAGRGDGLRPATMEGLIAAVVPSD